MVGKCLYCDKEFTYYRSQKNGKYCNNSCQQKWQRKNVIEPAILQGKSSNVGSLKRYIIETRGNYCEVCSGSPIHNGKPLKFELHHKDENSDNNHPDNLQLVCPNCHSQMPISTKKKNTKRSKINGLRKVSNL